MRSAPHLLRSFLFTAWAGITGLGFGGCSSDLTDIDARADRLIRERTERLGGGAVPARRLPAGSIPPGRGALYEKNPVTANAEPAEFRYSPADEARDINKRLQEFLSNQNSGQEVMTLDLPGALRVSQQTGREFLTEEEEYTLAAIRLLVERHLWEPRFFNDTTVGINRTSRRGDAAFNTPLRIINELRATQRLPFGGEVEAAFLFDATEQLRTSVSGQYEQSSAVVLQANVPLLRGAGLVAQEDLIQAERDLVYAARNFEDFRRRYLVEIATDYFRLLQLQAQIDNQKNSLRLLDDLRTRTKALVDAGRAREFELGIAESNFLEGQSALVALQETYAQSLDRFKIRLGLPISQPLTIAPFVLPLAEPDTTPAAATELALTYRLDLQNERDRADDARRAILTAQNQLLPDLDVSGNVRARTDPSVAEGGLVYESRDVLYGGAVTFGLPLDRETERLTLRSRQIAAQRAQRRLEEVRDQVVSEVRGAVRDMERARFDLVLAEQGVKINERRQEEQEIKRSEVSSQQFVETADQLLRARNARDRAMANLRIAVLNYLVATGQLRVDREGQLLRLPGMGRAEGAPMSDGPAAPAPVPAPGAETRNPGPAVPINAGEAPAPAAAPVPAPVPAPGG